MNKLFYIKKIVRDDQETLEFDQNELYLDENNSLLTRPEVETTKVEYTEADGGEMVAQRLATGEQVINGLIVPKSNDFFTLRNRLAAFFQINRTYYIVYEKISGETLIAGSRFKTGSAWIAENLQVPPEPREDYARWTVTLGIGSAGFQEYAEDPSGKEIFANNINIGLISGATGGEEWDETGSVWDETGSVWATGDGGLQNISVASTTAIYPVWEVKGTATNPSIRNNTVDAEATYNGTIAAGQTLLVDFTSGTATLDGVDVTRNLTGDFRMKPGNNIVGFEIDSGSTTQSTIRWNNYIQ